jgi:rubrerythrin
MPRKTITVNFDNDLELYKYVNKKENKSDFIRECIKEKVQKEKDHLKTLEGLLEKVVIRCLKEYGVKEVSGENEEEDILKAAAQFFED